MKLRHVDLPKIINGLDDDWDCHQSKLPQLFDNLVKQFISEDKGKAGYKCLVGKINNTIQDIILVKNGKSAFIKCQRTKQTPNTDGLNYGAEPGLINEIELSGAAADEVDILFRAFVIDRGLDKMIDLVEQPVVAIE